MARRGSRTAITIALGLAAALLVAVALGIAARDASSRDVPTDPRVLVGLGACAGALVLAAVGALLLGRRR